MTIEYIPKSEWAKMPPELRRKIRKTELSNDHRSLSSLYKEARKYATWSFMNTDKIRHI